MMLGLNDSRLAAKLRMSTGVLVAAVMAGSIFAYWQIHRVRTLSSAVLTQQAPMVEALRNLRYNTSRSASSLKSFLLFGMDPEIGARYKKERAESWTGIDRALADIRNLEAHSNFGAVQSQLDQTIAEIDSIRDTEARVEQLAVGHGSDSTGQAYDLLRDTLAEQEARAALLINSELESVQAQTQSTMRSMDEAGQTVAIVLWASTLFGILVGGVLSHQLARRIVSSILAVVERTQAIAAGDLTGEPLAIASNDEIAQLAESINAMQRNLHKILTDMTEIARSVHIASERLSDSTRSSFHRAEEQTRQTQMAAAAMQQMSISIAEVSQHAHNAASSAREASDTAVQGGAIVEQSLESITSIADSVRSAASTVQRLGHESEQISRIVNVIEDIASNTNLLALNAAIEAARAGEAGRGFAVVAGEVRRLAESTRNATSEIGQMIEGIRAHTMEAVGAMEAGTAKVEKGVSTTTRAGDALQRIIQMANHVDGMIAQIATASTQQASGAQQSSENLDVIHRLSNDAASTIPETQRTVESVEREVKRLQEHISHFQLAGPSLNGIRSPEPVSRGRSIQILSGPDAARL